MIRHSYTFRWTNEPWFVGGIIKDSVEEKIRRTVKYTLDYYLLDKIAAYQAIKAGDVEAPISEEDE